MRAVGIERDEVTYSTMIQAGGKVRQHSNSLLSACVCMACCMAEEAGLDCLRDGKALDLAACFEYFDELKADSAVAPSYGR
jgi:hypothetical protein